MAPGLVRLTHAGGLLDARPGSPPAAALTGGAGGLLPAPRRGVGARKASGRARAAAGAARWGAACRANFGADARAKLFQRGGWVPACCQPSGPAGGLGRGEQPSAPRCLGGRQSLLAGTRSFILIFFHIFFFFPSPLCRNLLIKPLAQTLAFALLFSTRFPRALQRALKSPSPHAQPYRQHRNLPHPHSRAPSPPAVASTGAKWV